MFNRRNSRKPSSDMISAFKPRFDQREPFATTSASESAVVDALAFQSDIDFSHFHDHSQDKDDDFDTHAYGLPMDLRPGFTPKDSTDDLFGSAPPPLQTPGIMSHHWGTSFHDPRTDAAMVTPASAGTSSLNALNLQSSYYTHNQFQPHRASPNPFRGSNFMSSDETFAPHQMMQSETVNPSQAAFPSSLPSAESKRRATVDDVSLSMLPKLTGQALPLPHIQQQLENFRFHVTLKAPTAMLSKSDSEEATITYLNKRQPYPLSVTDTQPSSDPSIIYRYRTSVRVCFDDPQQRAKPAAFWQLFRDGRGINEASSRGGKLQAVEWVESDSGLPPNVKFEASYFDGFCFTWCPTANGVAECTVQALFNFLSTDFSHSKGVKGVAVRLCTKTEIIGTVDDKSRHRSTDAEIAYCKVKTFRDHGAERKLANDKSAADRHIKKLTDAIEQAAKGGKEGNKRRRSDSVVNSRPSKVAKHKRTWSISSGSSNEGLEVVGGDLQSQLKYYEARFKTARSQTWLYLHGEDQDDPDLHPVEFLDVNRGSDGLDITPGIVRQNTQNTSKSSNQSPTPSVFSAPSLKREQTAVSAHTSPVMRRASTAHFNQSLQPPILPGARFSNPQGMASPPSIPSKISGGQSSSDQGTEVWLDAVGIDPTYQPPAETHDKPVACFYIKPSVSNVPAQDDYYRAIYLKRRTVEDLTIAIALKSGINPSTIDDVLRITHGGIPVKIDQEVVEAIPEGQDMLAEFYEVEDASFDFFDSTSDAAETTRYILKLRYGEKGSTADPSASKSG